MQYLSNQTRGSRPFFALKSARSFCTASHFACGSSDQLCERKKSTWSKVTGRDFSKHLVSGELALNSSQLTSAIETARRASTALQRIARKLESAPTAVTAIVAARHWKSNDVVGDDNLCSFLRSDQRHEGTW